MKKNLILLSFLCGLIACESSKGQEKVLYQTISVLPVNETKALPDLSLFVNQLIEASERKDTAFVLSVVDDSAAVSYGGGLYGKEAFLQEFIKYSNGFEKLKQVLELGGTIEEDDVYLFPYVQSYKLYKDQVDTIELDPFLTAVGIDSALVVYSKPKDNAEKKAVLAYPMLQLDPDSGYMQSNWAKVSTIDNKLKGFVKKDRLYFAADITLNIQKKGNSFKIIAVAPYD
jgi:hypothetical protein